MKKELRQALRDRRMAVMLIIAPVLQLIVLGFAVDLDVDQVPTVVCDQDHSLESRQVVESFVAGGTFRQVAVAPSGEQASAFLDQGLATVAVIIAPGFGRDIQRGVPTQVQVLIDGTDPNRAQVAANAATQFLTERSVNISLQAMAQQAAALGRSIEPPRLGLVPRILYNPRMRSATYMVPGVAATVLLIVTTILTAMGISREREIGTLEQILVTPLRPAVLLVGKCLPFAALGLVEVTAILTIGSYLFDVPIRGSVVVIYIGTLLYVLSTLGVGVFISTVSRSQQQAILGGFFFLMPAILLSGFMSPIENMPGWIRWLTFLNPVRYYVEILRSCQLKGAGFSELSSQLVSLALFGVAIFTLGALRFRKRLA